MRSPHPLSRKNSLLRLHSQEWKVEDITTAPSSSSVEGLPRGSHDERRYRAQWVKEEFVKSFIGLLGDNDVVKDLTRYPPVISAAPLEWEATLPSFKGTCEEHGPPLSVFHVTSVILCNDAAVDVQAQLIVDEARSNPQSPSIEECLVHPAQRKTLFLVSNAHVRTQLTLSSTTLPKVEASWDLFCSIEEGRNSVFLLRIKDGLEIMHDSCFDRAPPRKQKTACCVIA